MLQSASLTTCHIHRKLRVLRLTVDSFGQILGSISRNSFSEFLFKNLLRVYLKNDANKGKQKHYFFRMFLI